MACNPRIRERKQHNTLRPWCPCGWVGQDHPDTEGGQRQAALEKRAHRRGQR